MGPGVVNLRISEKVHPNGYHFSRSILTESLYHRVAENSGGPHTLKYGVTVNHVLGMGVVLPDGELIQVGGDFHNQPGPDLLGLINGSEGTFGIVTKVI